MAQFLLKKLFWLCLCTTSLAAATTRSTKSKPISPFNLKVHDEAFVPDAVLVFTVENISTSCVPAKPTVLINGTAPGPELRLKEGRTSWIRVYNNISDQNVTVVSPISSVRFIDRS